MHIDEYSMHGMSWSDALIHQVSQHDIFPEDHYTLQ